jgi:dTMP kinase
MANFIVIEGIDGSGKTTLCKAVYNIRVKQNNRIRTFSEPTYFETGVRLRNFLSGKIELPPEDELELFIEDRKESVKRNINPSLESGIDVLLDRYYYSTAAYQANEHRSPREILDRNLKENFPVPNFLFFIEIEPRIALERISSRSENLDRFETLDKLETIYKNYQEILPPNTIRLKGEKPPEELALDVISILPF